MALPKKEEPESPLWALWVVGSIIVILGLAGLVALGYGIYYVADLVCVAADPANASAVCQDVRG